MSFRRRNEPLRPSAQPPRAYANSASTATTNPFSPQSAPSSPSAPSSTASPSTISTGTPSLDALLSPRTGTRSGLPLGTSLLLSESGATDYAGVLVRSFAAEGALQGHRVHVVLGEGRGGAWVAGLPGVAGEGRKGGKRTVRGDGRDEREGGSAGVEGRGKGPAEERLKIAWRYQGLPVAGEADRARAPPQPTGKASTATDPPFSHAFDLSTRLPLIHPSPFTTPLASPSLSPSTSPFGPILSHLLTALSSSPPSTIHRLLLPAFLSPPLYPPHSAYPRYLLPFLRQLRQLLSQHPTRLVVLLSLSAALFPRASALSRWMEVLSDGVLDLDPFPEAPELDPQSTPQSTSQSEREREAVAQGQVQMQGLIRIRKRPVLHDRGGGPGVGGGGGGGGGGTVGGIGVGELLGDDLAFALSRRSFRIVPFSLPPVESGGGAGAGAGAQREGSAAAAWDAKVGVKVAGKELEF